MVLCELLTNAFKHAFSGGNSGSVCVSAHARDGAVLVEVVDDGRGMPDGFDPRRSGSFGWQLIRMLATQLDGSVELIPSAPGTGVRLRFVDGSLPR
jgi:two-component sensor histidine kinase